MLLHYFLWCRTQSGVSAPIQPPLLAAQVYENLLPIWQAVTTRKLDAGVGTRSAASAPEGGRLRTGSVESLRDSTLPFFVIVLIGLGGFYAWAALVNRYVPSDLAIDVFGRSVEFHSLHKKLIGGWIAGALLAVATAIVAEILFVGWRCSSLRALLSPRGRSKRSDIGVFLLEMFGISRWLLAFFTMGIGLASGVWLRDAVHDWTGFRLAVVTWSLPAQVAGGFVVYTFLDYWVHRIQHTRVFWPLHRFHHAATDFYVLTSARVHPAEFAGIFLLNVPLTMVEMSPEAMTCLLGFVALLRYAVHSRIPSNFGFVGRWLIQSPLDHRMHHAVDLADGPGANYGLAPIWDRLFGTYRPGGRPDLVIGVREVSYRHGLWVMPDMLRDYMDFVRGLGRAAGFGPAARRTREDLAAASKPHR